MIFDQKPQMLSDSEEMKMLAHLDLDIEELEQRLELAVLIAADGCSTFCSCNGNGINCPVDFVCDVNCRRIC